jgi:hypothetical protein
MIPISRRISLAVFILVFVSLAVILGILQRDLLRDQVLQPAVNAFQTMLRVWRSFNPDKVWAVFILLLYILVLLTFPTLHNVFKRPSSQDLPGTDGRVKFWYWETAQFARQQPLTRYSVLELKKLVVEAVAFRQRCTLRQAERWIVQPENSVPPEVLWLFSPEGLYQSGDRRSLLDSILKAPASFADSAPNPNAQKLGRIVQYLEEQLEVPHDHPHS